MSCFRDVAQYGVCVQIVVDQPKTGQSGVVSSGQAAWAVRHVQNYTLLDHSPTASKEGRRVGPAL